MDNEQQHFPFPTDLKRYFKCCWITQYFVPYYTIYNLIKQRLTYNFLSLGQPVASTAPKNVHIYVTWRRLNTAKLAV